MSSFNLVKICLSVPASAPLMSWGKIDPRRGGIFVKYQKTGYFNIFTSRGMRPGVTKMFSINYSAPAHTVHQSPAPPLPGPRVSF